MLGDPRFGRNPNDRVSRGDGRGGGDRRLDRLATIPAEHPAWTPATIHGIVNSIATLAVVGAVPARRQRLGLLVGAAAAIGVGAWIGGGLVFRHGWRVRPAEEAEIVEERLDDPATAAAFAAARRDVDEFERQKTYLPWRDPAA